MAQRCCADASLQFFLHACLCNYPRQCRSAFKSDPAKLGMVFLKKCNEQNCCFDHMGIIQSFVLM